MSMSSCRAVSIALCWYIPVLIKWTFSVVCLCLDCASFLLLSRSLYGFALTFLKNTISSIMTFRVAVENLCQYERSHQMHNH